jgi:hypothetical protein
MLAVTPVYNAGRLIIVGDEANDAVEITADSSGNLLVNGIAVGPAADLRDIDIDLGGGDDDVFIHDVQVQNNVDIDTGSGADGVLIGSPLGTIDVNIGNALRVETGEGDDRVQLVDTDARSVSINTGAGFDTLDPVNRVTTQNFLTLEMEDGPDFLHVVEVSGKRVLLSGGDGTDLLQIDVPIAGKLVVRDFEIRVGVGA